MPWPRLVAVIAFYIIVLNLEPSLLVPRIMCRVIGLSPLLTLTALFIGLKLLGPLGGLLAVPVAAAIQVVVNEITRDLQPEAPVYAHGAEGAGVRTAGRTGVRARPLRRLIGLGDS